MMSDKQLLVIAGPCVIESEDNVMLIAGTMKEIAARNGIDYYFKASFDKANRTGKQLRWQMWWISSRFLLFCADKQTFLLRQLKRGSY